MTSGDDSERPGRADSQWRRRRRTLIALVATGAVIVGSGAWFVYDWYPKPCGYGTRSPMSTAKGFTRAVMNDDYGNAEHYFPCDQQPPVEQLEMVRGMSDAAGEDYELLDMGTLDATTLIDLVTTRGDRVSLLIDQDPHTIASVMQA